VCNIHDNFVSISNSAIVHNYCQDIRQSDFVRIMHDTIVSISNSEIVHNYCQDIRQSDFVRMMHELLLMIIVKKIVRVIIFIMVCESVTYQNI